MRFWGRGHSGKADLIANLGRGSRTTTSLARVSLAIACLAPYLVGPFNDAAAHELERALFASYLGWSLIYPCIGRLSWRADVRLWPYMLMLDWLVCASILLRFEVYALPVLMFAVLLLSAIHARFGSVLTLIAGVALGAAFALRGFVGPPSLPLPPYSISSLILSCATLLVAGFVAIWFTTSRTYQAALKAWRDELLLMGGNLKTLPVDFLLEKLVDLFEADQVAFLWKENEEDAIHMTLYEAGSSVMRTLPSHGSQQLLDPEACEGTFLFDPEAQALLCDGRRSHPLVVDARPLTELIARNFTGRSGQSYPVRVGAVTARVYIAGRRRISEDTLRETERASELTEAMFERHLLLRAWRDRSFVEARHALSRDLHDSILQTLAALRMQIATVLSGDERERELARSRLQNMEAVIVAEQTRLRKILDESYRASAEKANLSALLEECVASLSRQWGIACRFCAAEQEIIVDGNTAVEVEFLVREAIANAAQHAKAKQITLVVALNEGALLISLRNDSRHRRPPAGTGSEPRIDLDSRSLARRLTMLGGSAYSEDTSSGSLVAMRIPVGRG